MRMPTGRRAWRPCTSSPARTANSTWPSRLCSGPGGIRRSPPAIPTGRFVAFPGWSIGDYGEDADWSRGVAPVYFQQKKGRSEDDGCLAADVVLAGRRQDRVENPTAPSPRWGGSSEHTGSRTEWSQGLPPLYWQYEVGVESGLCVVPFYRFRETSTPELSDRYGMAPFVHRWRTDDASGLWAMPVYWENEGGNTRRFGVLPLMWKGRNMSFMFPVVLVVQATPRMVLLPAGVWAPEDGERRVAGGAVAGVLQQEEGWGAVRACVVAVRPLAREGDVCRLAVLLVGTEGGLEDARGSPVLRARAL